MNDYGRMAMRHMQEFLPAQYATIEDPQSYFANLGDEVDQQVSTMQRQIAGPGSDTEPFMERVGRLNMARLMAEEKVLAEMVYLPPEREAQPDEPQTDETGAYVGGPPGWEPSPMPSQEEMDLEEFLPPSS